MVLRREVAGGFTHEHHELLGLITAAVLFSAATRPRRPEWPFIEAACPRIASPVVPAGSVCITNNEGTACRQRRNAASTSGFEPTCRRKAGTG